MKIRFFYSNNDYIQRVISIKNGVEAKRLSKAYMCLKQLGKFDTRIEVFSDDNNSAYVIDNNGRKFYLDIFPRYYTNDNTRREHNYSVAEEVREGKYQLYRFLLDKIEKTDTIYVFDDVKVIKKSHPHWSYQYDYVDKNVIYSLRLDDGVDISDQFIAKNILNKPQCLIDYVNNFKAVSDVDNYKWIEFMTQKNVDKKDSYVVSKISYLDGTLDKVDVVEETDDEYLHMWLEDGELKQKVIRKVSLPIEEADKKLQKIYKNITKMNANKKV